MATRTVRTKRSSCQNGRVNSIAAIKRQRTARLASLATRAYYLHRRGQNERMYNLVCEEFMSLGGIYIKFLQGVLLQSQIMRRWHNPDKLKIFENLDHEQIDIVQTLQHELPSAKLAQISLVQPQPFAAGSFGQVYYGQHVSGKPIIIKVLRPLVTELLRYDLRILAMFSRSFVSKMSTNIDINMDQAVKDFRLATLRETDYRAEAAFARELYEAYKGHSTFIIPETFTELCTEHIIVQEYVDGLSVAQLLRLQEQGIDPKTYVQETLGSDLDEQLVTLGVESVSGVFNLPRVQGDPHPGNIRLMSGNRVGMIDFGIAASAPENKAAFFGIIESWHGIYNNDFNLSHIFEQFIRFFVNDLYRALDRLAMLNRSSTGHGEAKNYTQEMGRIAQDTFQKAVGTDNVRPMIEDGRIVAVVNEMVNKDNRFGFVMKLESSEILRAAQTYMSMVDRLGRRTAVFPKVFAEVVRRVQAGHPELIHAKEESMSVASALEVISRWLERVATRDPALFRQLLNRIKLKDGRPITDLNAADTSKEETDA